ncbi:MAG: TauD/TfdA family dioxygenase, partial [Gammaproteobacteria bacterium]
PEMRVSMALRQGDIQFVNNFVVLHARTAYRDSPQHVRKLLRLWLDDENSRRLGPGKMDWYLPAHSRFTRTGGLEALSR